MYIVNGVVDPDGRQTDVLAKRYSREHNVSYSDALHHVVRGEQVKQRQYAQESPESQSIQKLGALVANLPKLSDGTVDINLALETVNGSEVFSELAKQAAGEFLNNLAQRLLGSAHPHENITLADTLRVAARDNPSIASMYSGNRATVEGLRGILWTIFRYQSATSVKKYSAGHVYFDESGNEVHTYSLAVRR